MHAEELPIDADLVTRLLAAQFPRWASLPLRRVPSAGTDHALYRLGGDLVVRLPRIAGAAGQVEKEQRWLPRLAPLLPLDVPSPLAQGAPGAGYPWNWSVYRWLEGENATTDRIVDAHQAALDLANFLSALHGIVPAGGSSPLPTSSRCAPLAARDQETREAMALLAERFDARAMTAVWETALAQPEWRGPPLWLHGDLHAGNLLAKNGRLRAVIDFGCLGVGDPAADVMAAWLYLPAAVRDTFRAALGVDDATWARARGWALSVGLIAFPYYEHTNPELATIAWRAIEETLN